jgi:hypothetical protein
MTNLTEAKLAREAEICYATLALVTDYDCWHEGRSRRLRRRRARKPPCEFRARGRDLGAAVEALPAHRRSCACGEALAHAIITPVDAMTPEARAQSRRSARQVRSAKEPLTCPSWSSARSHSTPSRPRSRGPGGARGIRRALFGRASFFTPVRLVAVVGEDFAAEHRQPLLDRNGRPLRPDDREGEDLSLVRHYGDDLNSAQPLDTQLNVFADFRPEIPEAWRDTPLLFLANIDPELQWSVLEQARERSSWRPTR